ncbi:MAG TPA: hypothetical protein VE053_06835 [Allosphingosinicella sp.]|nr:hypothetical protein [Allosphingosinicella sp.]
MDKTETEALVERFKKEAAEKAAEHTDDGFQLARALLHVMGKRFGVAFVLEVQREVLAHADNVATWDEPFCREAADIREVANAGYFTDLIDALSVDEPAGRA